jgi:hypothetical protein
MQRPGSFLQLHSNSFTVIYSSSPSTDHRRCSKEDEPIVALGSPGMSVPKIIRLDEGQLGCLPYCLLLCSSQVPIYFLLSICSSIFACSSTSHALHILVPITLVILLSPYSCCTVCNEPRYFPLTEFSRRLNPCVLLCNSSQTTPQYLNAPQLLLQYFVS